MNIAKISLLVALGLGRVFAADIQGDADFRAVQALATPRSPSPGPLTPAQVESERRQQIALMLLASAKAQAFHEKNPAHPAAAEARKIEVVSLFRAVRDGAPEHEGKALVLARAFRTNSANSPRDRFEVAATARLWDVQRQNHGQSTADALAAYEKVAKDLYGEFPNEPAVFDLFLGVARTADASKARAVANQLLLMPAPALVKDEARALLARLDMPGKPLNADWSDEQGRLHQLQDYKGKIVVFYVWATWAASTDGEQRIKALPANVVLVSVNIDEHSAKGKADTIRKAIGGIAHYDNRGLNAPLVRQLRATKVPGLYVVNAKGVFVGGGSPETLPTLLASAAQP